MRHLFGWEVETSDSAVFYGYVDAAVSIGGRIVEVFHFRCNGPERHQEAATLAMAEVVDKLRWLVDGCPE